MGTDIIHANPVTGIDDLLRVCFPPLTAEFFLELEYIFI